MAHPLRDKVDQHDGDDNEQKDGADIRVIEFADGLDQILPDPAGADKAHHSRAPDVNLESQEGIAYEIRKNLRHRTKSDNLKPASSACRDPLNRFAVDIFDNFGELFAQRRFAVLSSSTMTMQPSVLAASRTRSTIS